MDKKCCGLETGRQVSNLHLPNSRSDVLSQLNYIRVRFRLPGDNPQRAAHRKLKKRQKWRKSFSMCFRSSTAERRSLKSWLWVQLPSEAPEFDESRISAILLAMT